MSAPAQRKTRQKTAIRAVFEEHNRPLSPQEVLELAQQEVEGLGIATVYRNLKALVEDGWLTPVEMPGGHVLYEPAGKGHHHHFQCEHCNRVFELEGCIPTINKLAKPGFKVVRHEVILYGICAGCCRGSSRN
ncbi:MAG: Fur family transcriptional regulator [Bryobacteraceae bacterium]